MIMEQLKNETKEAHQLLERLLIPYIKQTNTIEAYIRLLQMFYGYMKPVEALIDEHIAKEEIPFYSSRRKALSLLHDLTYWKHNDLPPLADELPEITNHYQALGAMYVFEGSTLGGSIINKILMENLGKDSQEGFSFYNGYGDETREMWTSFTEAVNNTQMDSDDRNEIVMAANDTFTKFKNWAAGALIYADAEEKL